MATVVTFAHRHYVPLLKGKEGEYGALRELGAAARAVTTPLVELAPPDGDVDKALDRFIARMESWWSERAFVDDLWIDPTTRTAGGKSALRHVLDKARTKQLALVPVTGVRRTPAQQSTVGNYAAATGSGACLRLTFTEIRAATFPADLATTLAAVNLPAHQVDVVVDLAAVDPGVADVVGTALAGIITGMPHLRDWRTLTVASSAFPGNLGGLSGVTTAPRGEWGLWRALLAAAPARLPAYGDYAIETPGFFAYAPYIDPHAAIRYTDDDTWLIVRGTSVRRGAKYGQFNALAKTLTHQPAFRGASFSWGDKFIDDCAKGGSTGNLTTWRKVGTNHHAELVAHQLAALP